MKAKNLIACVFVSVFILKACICIADERQDRNPYMKLGGLIPEMGIEQTYIGARLGSYKPDLRQLDALLKAFRVSAPGAATIFNIFAKFEGSPQLSYLIEAGYWDNETSLRPAAEADLGATFTYVSLSVLYYPELIRDFLPMYLGIGGGIANMKLYGSALELLKEAITKREDTGLGGNFIIGLEYMILERMMVNIQANHIFKDFAVDKNGDREFSFDGTVVSIGVSAKF